MCGPAATWGDMGPARAFRRNTSINSTIANNEGAPAPEQAAVPCTPACLDKSDWNDSLAQLQDVCNSGVSSLSCPDPCHQCQTAAEQPACQVPPLLLLGTSAGLFQLDLVTQELQLLGLEQQAVGHVSYGNGLILASCPVPDDPTAMSAKANSEAAAAAGLYCFSASNQLSSSPFDSGVQVTKLWDGNARCSALGPSAAAAAGAAAGPGAPPRIYLGTQPADLLFSDNLGKSWESTGLAAAPQAKNWYRMLPPYEPAVRSISSSFGTGVVRDSCSCDSGDPQAAQAQVLVGVEVGGAMTLSHNCSLPSSYPENVIEPQPPAPAMDICSSSSSWQECSQGLCRDIHALQHDPFSSQRMYAVAGSGNLPGGLYRCRGNKWKRLFGYRYSVGMAVSRYQKGRLLLVSADKPPAIGCTLFESLDGGRHWANITDEVVDAAMCVTDHELGLFEHTPVTMFVPGGLVVSCSTGQVFFGASQPTGGFSNWRMLAKVPAAVNCMCLTDEAAAPAAVSRS